MTEGWEMGGVGFSLEDLALPPALQPPGLISAPSPFGSWNWPQPKTT